MSHLSQQDAPKIDFESRIANSTDANFIDKLIKSTDVTALPTQFNVKKSYIHNGEGGGFQKKISAANFKPLKVEHQHVVSAKEIQQSEE